MMKKWKMRIKKFCLIHNRAIINFVDDIIAVLLIICMLSALYYLPKYWLLISTFIADKCITG